MSKIKIKSEESSVAAVFVARSKLDGVLQTLVDQKEDGASPEKDLFNPPDTDSDHLDSPISSPAKKSPRVNRLQRKRKLVKEEVTPTDFQTNSNACLVRLFDRTVDLASFNENTPLYPICRAWIRNMQPISLPERTSSDVYESDTCDFPLIYELPGPTMVKSENGESIHPRIPSPIREQSELFYINQDSSSVVPEDIFLNHMKRWKLIRQKWKKASRDDEARYIESFKILQDMYDKQNS